MLHKPRPPELGLFSGGRGRSWRAVPRQQRFACRRQAFEDMAQPGVGLLAVGLGGFDQAVDLGTGRGALGRVAEQPVLAPDDKRADGVLSAVVVDR